MIKTKRTFLRALQPSDRDSFFSYRSDAKTNQYQGWIPKTIKDVDDFIARSSHQIDQPESWFQLVIIHTLTQNMIGDIGIHFIGADSQQCELGITLRKDNQGKGFAAEVMEATIDFLFNDLKKHRITTSIDPKNTSSIQLVERLGLRKEAHFKASYFFNGQWTDDVIYAILSKEWDIKRPSIDKNVS